MMHLRERMFCFDLKLFEIYFVYDSYLISRYIFTLSVPMGLGLRKGVKKVKRQRAEVSSDSATPRPRRTFLYFPFL